MYTCTQFIPSSRVVHLPVYIVLARRHYTDVGHIDNLLKDHRGGEVLWCKDDYSRSFIHSCQHSWKSKRKSPVTNYFMKIILKQFYAHSQNVNFLKKNPIECNLQDNYHKIKMNHTVSKNFKSIV